MELSTANSFIVPGGGIRRRSNLGLISSSINPKKIYESWLMTLRIRTYFANLRVVQDPELLSQLSSRIEPSGKDSRTVQPAVVSSVGNAGTTTTKNNNSSANEGNDPQQLYTSNLPSSNNNTKLKGSDSFEKLWISISEYLLFCVLFNSWIICSLATCVFKKYFCDGY